MSEDKSTAIRTQLTASSTYKEFQSRHLELARDRELRDKFLEYFIEETMLRGGDISSVTLQSLEKSFKAFMQGPWIQYR